MSPAEQPDRNFEKLRSAHDRLAGAYVEAHRKAESKVWARPIVDGHLRRQSRALRDAYIQARETTFDSPAESEWLLEEADEWEKLESTFTEQWRPGTVTKTITSVFGFPGLVGLLGFTGLSAALLALLESCLCHLMAVTPLLAGAALAFTYVLGFVEEAMCSPPG